MVQFRQAGLSLNLYQFEWLRCLALVLLIVLGVPNLSHAQYWQTDPTFTPPDLETAPTGSVYIPTQLLHDGSMIVFADGTHINGKYISGGVKLDRSGAIDPSFKAPENLSNVYPLFAYPDSRVLIAITNTFRPNDRVERLLASGAVDSTFNPDFRDDTVLISHAALQTDGKILLCGTFAPFASTNTRGLVRLNPDGTTDASFATNTAEWTAVYWVSLQSDGKILVIGVTGSAGSAPQVARLNSDGTSDTTFTDNFTVGSTYPHWVVQLSDGHLLGSLPTNFSDFLVRTDNAGTIDRSFAPTTPGNYSVPPPPAANGKIYFSWNDSFHGNHVRRLNADGTLDLSFDVPGESNVDPVGIPEISDDGLLYFNSPLTNSRKNAASFLSQTDAAGVLNANYAPRLGAGAAQMAIALRTDGKYLVLSNSEIVANHALPHPGVVRLNHDGSFDTFVAAVDVSVFTPLTGVPTAVQPLADGKIVGSAGSFFNVDTNGAVALNYLPQNPNQARQSRLDTFSAFMADGSFYQVHLDDTTHLYSVRHYSIDCKLDSTFQFTCAEEVSVYPAPNGTVYVDQQFSGLGRLNGDGSIDATFKTIPPSSGRTVWVFPDSTIFLTEPQNSNFVSPTPNDFTTTGARETHYDLSGNPQYIFDGVYDLPTIAGTVYDRLKTVTANGSVQSTMPYPSRMIVSTQGEATLSNGGPTEGGGWNVRRLVRTPSAQSYNPAPLAAKITAPSPTAASGSSITLTAQGGGLYPLQYQWYLNDKKISGATDRMLSIASASTTDSGNYTVTITNTYGQATSPSVSLLVAAAPQVLLQPVSTSAAVGGTASFSVVASPGVTYDWQYQPPGEPWFSVGEYPAYQGVNTSQLQIVHVTADLYGTSYRCVVTDPSTGISTASDAVQLLVLGANPFSSDSRFANISTRAYVGTGAGIEIGGFIISGSQPKQVLIRGLGPALTQYGVTGALSDPVLKLFSGQSQIGSNDDWSSDPTNTAAVNAATTELQITAFPSGSKDSALVVTLSPGGYTAQLSGKNGVTGVGLIELYEIDTASSDSRLINISTRSETRSGAGIQIAGFIITGTQPKTVLVRALGPALQSAHVNGFLDDPVLKLFSGQTTVAQNDNWSDVDWSATEIESATTRANAVQLPPGSADSAILVSLLPGAYTAQVSGKNGHTGVTLIEVYEIP